MTVNKQSELSKMTADEIRAWAVAEGFDDDLSTMDTAALRSWAIVKYMKKYLGYVTPRPNPVKQAVDADWPVLPWLLRAEPGAPGCLSARGVPDRYVTVVGLRRVADDGALALLVREGDTLIALRRSDPHDTWAEDTSTTQILAVGLGGAVAVTSWQVPTPDGAVPDLVPAPAGPASDLLLLDLERTRAFPPETPLGRGTPAIRTEDELRWAFRNQRRRTGGEARLRVLPGPDYDRDPDGCVVVDGRGDSWSVYRIDCGVKDRREFATSEEAFDFAHRRWVLWDENA